MEPRTLSGFDEDVEMSDRDPVGLGGKTAVVSSGPALTDLIRKGGMWVSLGLGFALLGIGILAYWPRTNSAPPPSGTIAPLNTTPVEAPADSLGIKFTELPARWNEVDTSPRITRGIARVPEAGRFDAFTYRFSQSSLLAGVYGDGDDYLYLLLASAWLSDDNATRMALHLCHVAHPFSQECIDGYFESGLGGQPLDSYRDVEHTAEWKIGDIVWRLRISENVQQIRVIAPGASR